MGCNCTANLRADIIKRFFANQFNGKEFALELIRIVECQQTAMSRELEDWFKVWFRFPQDMLEEFLACVMNRQQTMSDRLQKAIRVRFFPSDQRMADDFIKVVLCSCCPTLCGTDTIIINTSNNFTVDGWYLQEDASNLVYMESGIITETVACESGIANYGHNSGGGYESPHVFLDGIWNPIIYVELKDTGGTSYEINVTVDGRYQTGSSILVESSIDGGVTWQEVGTSTQFDNPTIFPFDIGTSDFIYRTTLILANGCQFYNPAPSQSSSTYCIDYAIIDGGAFFNLLGTINGVTPPDQAPVLATMGEPYQGVTGAYGGVYLPGGADVFYLQVSRPNTSPVTASLATILDAGGAPVDASPQFTACELHRQIAQFTFVDANLTGIQTLTINGMVMTCPNTFAINQVGLADDIKNGLMTLYGLYDPNLSIYIYQIGTECYVQVDSLFDFQELTWQDTLGNVGVATFILQ